MIGKFDLPRFAIKNKGEITNSERAGCYHCLAIFPTKEVTEWTDAGKTALCPRCNIDAVIAEICGYELTEAALRRGQEYWF